LELQAAKNDKISMTASHPKTLVLERAQQNSPTRI
jgi:hypothetical protein